MASLLVDADRKVLCGILDGVGDQTVLGLVRVDSLNLSNDCGDERRLT